MASPFRCPRSPRCPLLIFAPDPLLLSPLLILGARARQQGGPQRPRARGSARGARRLRPCAARPIRVRGAAGDAGGSQAPHRSLRLVVSPSIQGPRAGRRDDGMTARAESAAPSLPRIPLPPTRPPARPRALPPPLAPCVSLHPSPPLIFPPCRGLAGAAWRALAAGRCARVFRCHQALSPGAPVCPNLAPPPGAAARGSSGRAPRPRNKHRTANISMASWNLLGRAPRPALAHYGGRGGCTGSTRECTSTLPV